MSGGTGFPIRVLPLVAGKTLYSDAATLYIFESAVDKDDPAWTENDVTASLHSDLVIESHGDSAELLHSQLIKHSAHLNVLSRPKSATRNATLKPPDKASTSRIP